MPEHPEVQKAKTRMISKGIYMLCALWVLCGCAQQYTALGMRQTGSTSKVDKEAAPQASREASESDRKKLGRKDSGSTKTSLPETASLPEGEGLCQKEDEKDTELSFVTQGTDAKSHRSDVAECGSNAADWMEACETGTESNPPADPSRKAPKRKTCSTRTDNAGNPNNTGSASPEKSRRGKSIKRT